jgi:phytoene dehydrogenase-like protein
MGTVASELNRHITSPQLRAALANVTLYTGLPPDRTPSMQILGTVAMLLDHFYIPEGGMGAIPAVLATEFARLGGTLHLNASVDSIVITNGRVEGVEVRDHGRQAFDSVVSTTSGVATCASLLKPGDVPAALRRKTARAPLSQRGLSVQLGLRNRLTDVSHFNYRTPWLEQQRRMVRPAQGAGARFIAYIVPTVSMPELASSGGSIVELFPPIDQSLPVAQWTPEAGEEAAASAIETLSTHHRLDIAVRRIRTPKVFRDQMLLYEGAFYGLAPTAGPRSQYAHATSIPGLYQAGQTTHPGFGIGPSILSGIFASECVTREGDR